MLCETDCYAIVERDLGDPDDSLFLQLRWGKGIDRPRFAQLCDALESLSLHWSRRELVPKRIVRYLVNAQVYFEGCLSLYRGADRDEVESAAGTLGTLAEKALYGEPENGSG